MIRWPLFLILVLVVTVGGCRKNPVDRLVNADRTGALTPAGNTFWVYDEELKTGGGLGFFPGGENQSIDLEDASAPRRSANAIRYQWNGQDVANNGEPQHLFAGFALSITPDLITLNSGQPKNLTGYSSVRLWIRGSTASDTTVRIEGPDDGEGGETPARVELTPTADWQEIALTVPSNQFTNLRTFLTVSFQYAQPPRTGAAGGGGVVFIDDIRYE